MGEGGVEIAEEGQAREAARYMYTEREAGREGERETEREGNHKYTEINRENREHGRERHTNTDTEREGERSRDVYTNT